MDIVVFYDECFAKAFKNTTTKVRALMAIVEEKFSEFDSLGTTIQFQEDFPIVPKLLNNWCDKDWRDIMKYDGELGLIASSSTLPAHAYIFLTHGSVGHGQPLGIARLGAACDPHRRHRISLIKFVPYWINRYGNRDIQTAEVFC